MKTRETCASIVFSLRSSSRMPRMASTVLAHQRTKCWMKRVGARRRLNACTSAKATQKHAVKSQAAAVRINERTDAKLSPARVHVDLFELQQGQLDVEDTGFALQVGDVVLDVRELFLPFPARVLARELRRRSSRPPEIGKKTL